MREGRSPLTGRRILIVEDEYMIATEMERWLQGAGAVVLGPVPGVDQALDLINEEGAPDAAVLDINLGVGETAYPVADRLSAIGVPFLFATGEVRVSDAASYQGCPRLCKPIARRELLRTIESLLSEGCVRAA